MSQNTLILCFPRLFLYQDKSQFSRKKLLKYILPSRKINICLPFQNHSIRTCSVDHKIIRIIKNQHSPPFQTTISGPAQWTSLAKLRVSRQWKGLANISSQSGVKKATVEVPEYNVIRQTFHLGHGCKVQGKCILFIILSLCFILEFKCYFVAISLF